MLRKSDCGPAGAESGGPTPRHESIRVVDINESGPRARVRPTHALRNLFKSFGIFIFLAGGSFGQKTIMFSLTELKSTHMNTNHLSLNDGETNATRAFVGREYGRSWT